jgi:prepilin-type N-terminal cleavage/methylation domain-containing protein
MQKHISGFTLIELLIVVAIIAILAAIAIPNFLQAQVRSKVSRVQSDVRTITMGIESYYVDENAYPLEYFTWGNPGNQQARLAKVYTNLTTPVAYITSIPQDPFQVGYMQTTYYWYYNWLERTGHQINIVTDYHMDAPWFDRYISGAVISLGPSHFTPGSYGIMVYDPTNGTVTNGCITRLFPG